MPKYSIRYVCETPITAEQEFDFTVEGQKATLNFTPQLTELGRAYLTLVIEAASWRNADVKAQGVLQPIMNALTFCTGQSTLLLYWDLILKDEAGSETRRALWCHKSETLNHFNLREGLAEEVQKLLDNKLDIALCWHRYAVQRDLTLDRFVFQWLAFESLAGQTLVNRPCEKCGHIFEHQAADRISAFKMLLAIDPDITEKEFKRDVWGRDRNGVFHGSKYPNPEHLWRLNKLTPKLRTACEKETSRRVGLEDRQRPMGETHSHFYFIHFIQWNTNEIDSQFVRDFPADAVAKEFTGREMGAVWMSVSSEQFTTLQFPKDAEEW
ncbi:MAG: hypothetical protein WAM66_07375 [Acidobacteriaceae bacterium]